MHRWFIARGSERSGPVSDLRFSVPYDPSSVEFDAKPDVNVILQNRVKQERIHQNANRAEKNISNAPIVQERTLIGYPKI